MFITLIGAVYFILYFFFFRALLEVYGSSQARG